MYTVECGQYRHGPQEHYNIALCYVTFSTHIFHCFPGELKWQPYGKHCPPYIIISTVSCCHSFELWCDLKQTEGLILVGDCSMWDGD